jgi:hypothetical protein
MTATTYGGLCFSDALRTKVTGGPPVCAAHACATSALSDGLGVSFNNDLPYDFGLRVTLDDTLSNGKLTPAGSEDRFN